MKIVEFDCGCIGLRDFDTEETIIFRHCNYAPDDVFFYFAGKDDHAGKPSRDLSQTDANFWMFRIATLIKDGKQMRTIRKFMKGD